MIEGKLMVLVGGAIATTAFVLYLLFLGLVPGSGVGPDDIAASTNLVVVAVGVGLVCGGLALHVKTRPDSH
ncbi:MAG: hypothetical protein KGI98_17380 [Euryarchaeota archaeon]|nr:hypothetical protein [Euryarchaeota archaeon]MDE1882147.1 hypothetical protein [Euryarchaeota archaeon]